MQNQHIQFKGMSLKLVKGCLLTAEGGILARPKNYTEFMKARFQPGTFARMDAALVEDEDRAGLVRLAVERELTRRERAAKRQQAKEGAEDG